MSDNPPIQARSRTRAATAPAAHAPPPQSAAVKPPNAPMPRKREARPITPFIKTQLPPPARPATTGRQPGENYDTPERKASMIDALTRFLGVVVYACLETGVSRATHYLWMQNDPEYFNEVNSIADTAVDYVEGRLLDNIKHGDTTAAIFYLKTKGKHRGYIERSEITGAEGGAINVNMTVEVVKEELPIEALQAVLLRTVFKGAALRPALPAPMKQLPQ